MTTPISDEHSADCRGWRHHKATYAQMRVQWIPNPFGDGYQAKNTLGEVVACCSQRAQTKLDAKYPNKMAAAINYTGSN